MDSRGNGSCQERVQRPKLIIAIKPQGSERLSAVVQEAADKIFGWNSDSIVGGIRELG